MSKDSPVDSVKNKFKSKVKASACIDWGLAALAQKMLKNRKKGEP
jgi:hypothetical protein